MLNTIDFYIKILYVTTVDENPIKLIFKMQ
jgi:hypothetical protein